MAQLDGSDISYNYNDGEIDVTAQLPEPINLSTNQGGGSSLSALSMSGELTTPLISGDFNVVAAIASIFGIPSEVFGDDLSLFDLGFASGSIDYTTLSAGLNASASYSQSFSFTPNAVQVSMTDSLGQTISGALGEISNSAPR